MRIIPISTERVDMHPAQNFYEWIDTSIKKNDQILEEKDILVVSSKIVSFFENRVIELSQIKVSEQALQANATEDCGPEIAQLVMDEADEIIADTKWVILTRKNGIYCANAGIDKRNVPPGYVVLWPEDAFKTAEEVRKYWLAKNKLKNIAVLVIDSICIPGRQGTVSVAIGYSGIQGYENLSGKRDLFGTPYRYTGPNIVDSLATAANYTMGESTELNPIVLIKNANWTAADSTKNDEMIISPSEDMFPL